MEYIDLDIEMLIDAYDAQKPISTIINSNKIMDFCNSDSIELRAWTAKVLAFDIVGKDSIDCLCRLATDLNASVRLEAIDSLSNFVSPTSYDVLCAAIHDSDELIRAYAAYGIAVVGCVLCPEDAREKLLAVEQYELNDMVRVGIYEGLYILGDASYFVELCHLYQSDDYKVRCAVVHALGELLNPSNSGLINAAAHQFDISKQPISVIDAVTNLRLMCSSLDCID